MTAGIVGIVSDASRPVPQRNDRPRLPLDSKGIQTLDQPSCPLARWQHIAGGALLKTAGRAGQKVDPAPGSRSLHSADKTSTETSLLYPVWSLPDCPAQGGSAAA